MSFALGSIIIGALLITITLSGTSLKPLPLSTAMLYLAAGYGLGGDGLGLLRMDLLAHPVLLERIAEAAVLISLFGVGLKLGLPLSNRGWHLPLRLALVSMTITVALVAAIGVVGLGLSLGAAILLAAILAPTDPVLASDVQVLESGDRDRLRFSLTGEGGLNDGAAFPFVMLGLGLLGLHDLGSYGWRWIVVDLLWAVVGGLLIGGAIGALVGRLVVYLRSRHHTAIGLNEFLVLGLIALAYGVAILSQAYGFLAVFAAGLALQRVQALPSVAPLAEASTKTPTDAPAAVPAEVPADSAADVGAQDPAAADNPRDELVLALEGFNTQLERIAEVAVVMLVGALLSHTDFSIDAVMLVILLLLVVRPLAVWLGLLGERVSRDQHILIS
ncbi:MAG TPA: cation:proton antiporter, partial [Azospira sp.]|nr:cation:proton antiporter [Azospira sp.]